MSGVSLLPRNPLPAQGGTPPEPLAEVKLLAPQAFRSKLERAITADDYAAIAGRNSKIQRAKATLRWTGSWYEVLVAIDPKSEPEAEQELLDEILGYLYPFRRIGHDLVTGRARYVPLDIAMTVCVKPTFLRGHVEADLLNVFSNRALPDGRLEARLFRPHFLKAQRQRDDSEVASLVCVYNSRGSGFQALYGDIHAADGGAG